MATRSIERQRQEIYEIAEAIAPTWERRRREVEAVSTPVRVCSHVRALAQSTVASARRGSTQRRSSASRAA